MIRRGGRCTILRDGRVVTGTVLSVSIAAGTRGWESDGYRTGGWNPTVVTTAGTVSLNRIRKEYIHA